MDRRNFLKVGTGMVSAFVIAAEGGELLFAADEPPLNVAVVGAGRQGRVLMGELDKFSFVKIAAVCDVLDGRVRSAQRRAKDARAYGDCRELLDKEKDLTALFIATPSHLHADIAVAGLAAGKHVFCEAPLATTVDDCRRIARAARESSSVFHVGLQFRSNPIYNLARSFLLSGAIRDVISLRGQYRSKTSWRTPSNDPAQDRALNWWLYPDVSTGLCGEFGTHQFDVMSWFLNSLPVSVSGSGALMLYKDGREIPDTVHCVMTWPGGIRMTYEATVANSYGGRFEELVGTMGAIRLIGDFGWMFKEADAPTQGWEVYAMREHFHKEEGIILIADATKLAKQGKLKEGEGLPQPPSYYGVQDFLASITKAQPSTCPAEVGLRAAVMGLKAHEAVAAGQEIAFDEEWFKV